MIRVACKAIKADKSGNFEFLSGSDEGYKTPAAKVTEIIRIAASWADTQFSP